MWTTGSTTCLTGRRSSGSLSQPTVNIEGLVAGYTGPGGKTILPGRAVAKLDLRLVPNQTRKEAVEKLRAHLDKRGFSDVEVNVSGGYDPTETAEDSRIIRAELATYQAGGNQGNAQSATGRILARRGVHRDRRCHCLQATSASVMARVHTRPTSSTWWSRRIRKSRASPIRSWVTST